MDQTQSRTVVRMLDRIHADSRLNKTGFVMAAPHCHPHCELFYIENGEGSFFIDNNMYELHTGDFLFIPPQVFHYTRYTRSACKRSNVFFRTGDIAGDIAAAMPHGAAFFDGVRIFRVPEAYRAQFETLISRMVREEKIDDARTAPMMRTLLAELLLLCSRECNFLSELPADIHTTDLPIVRAAQFISENYAENITAADVAAVAGYSANYLTKKFREAAGLGVHEYLAFIRLQHAALELVSTKDTVTEIALRCGFSDGNYFKDAFKKKYGVTPSKYRK
ncbi:MAG TPA: helix-turn-helix transcriptional regulator [Candidatus Coproplasma stercoravium]|nr:helix-turn-helix transcriptional regulator [Candidatus Coproplasma stercoravium]